MMSGLDAFWHILGKESLRREDWRTIIFNLPTPNSIKETGSMEDCRGHIQTTACKQDRCSEGANSAQVFGWATVWAMVANCLAAKNPTVMAL